MDRQQSLLVPNNFGLIRCAANLGKPQFNTTAIVCQPAKVVALQGSSGTPMSNAEEDSNKGSSTSRISMGKILPFGTGLANPDAHNLFLAAVIDSRPLPAHQALPSATVRSGGAGVNTPRNGRYVHESPIIRGADESQGRALGLHLDECRHCSPESSFEVLVGQTAKRAGVEPRALAVRTLLHLPRLASHGGWLTKSQVQRELTIQAKRLRGDVEGARRHVPVTRFLLSELLFEQTDTSRAAPVLNALHYLRSARPGSLYFAMVDPIERLPVCLCSVSPLEWKCVARQIRSMSRIPQEKVWDVSRVYSVNDSPRNVISTLLSRVRSYFKHNMPEVDLLVTAVDPNLGFTGASYRAANWQQWMTVKARPYLYENCRYVSPRQLRERYGTANLTMLQNRYPTRFQMSRAALLDSMIYCGCVKGKTKIILVQDRRQLHR